MIFEENVLYKVTTKEEDDWIRKQLDMAGFRWASGDCVLDLTYFDQYWKMCGAYYYEVKRSLMRCNGTTPETENHLGNTYKIVEIKNIYEKENFMENWMKYCVEAATPEEAYEKWKKGETVAKEQPELTLTVKNGYAEVKSHGELCYANDIDDVEELEEALLDYLDAHEDDERVLTEYEQNMLDYFEVMGCDTVYRIDYDICGRDSESDDTLVSVHNMHDEFDWLEEYEDYDIEELRDLYE